MLLKLKEASVNGKTSYPTAISNPTASFVQMEKPIFTFIWNHKGPRITVAILKEKSEVERLTLPKSRLTAK